MAYMISCECINCTACEMECPVRAISPAASQFVIDAGTCVECDGYFPVPRCSAVCPVAACRPACAAYQHKMAALAHRGAPPVRLASTRATAR
jgi:ferredoxin